VQTMSPASHPAAIAAEGAPEAAGLITVVIAEDHPRMRDTLRALLEAAPGLSVRAEAGNLALARQHVAGHRPDVLVLDLSMPDGSSIDMVVDLRQRLSETHIVAVSMEDAPGFAARALAAGANGYVLKDTADVDLPEAVHAAARGDQYVSASIAFQLANRPGCG
jgi:two-component system, NarL family, response regulator NreC